jgi:hypothetical protein
VKNDFDDLLVICRADDRDPRGSCEELYAFSFSCGDQCNTFSSNLSSFIRSVQPHQVSALLPGVSFTLEVISVASHYVSFRILFSEVGIATSYGLDDPGVEAGTPVR